MSKKPVIPLIMVLAAVVLSACAPKVPAPAAAAKPKGHLFIVGGGDRDEPLMRRYVELARAGGPGQGRRFHHGQRRPPGDRPRSRGRVQGLRRHRRRLLPPDAGGGPGAGQPEDPRRRHRRLVLRRRPGQADGRPARTPPFTSGCSSSTGRLPHRRDERGRGRHERVHDHRQRKAGRRRGRQLGGHPGRRRRAHRGLRLRHRGRHRPALRHPAASQPPDRRRPRESVARRRRHRGVDRGPRPAGR